MTNPERTVFAAKRLIGRRFDSDEVQRFKRVAPFGVEASENGDAWIRVGDRLRAPQEISAIVLAKMKEIAAEFLGEPIDRRRDHGAGLLQRRAAPGDEGRRHASRA